MPPKRKLRDAKSRTCSESGPPPPEDDQDNKKKKRQRKKTDNGTEWIDDDTVKDEKPVILTIHVSNGDDEDSSSDYVPEEDNSDDDQEFIKFLLENYAGVPEQEQKKQTRKREPPAKIPIKLTRQEETYYNKLTADKKAELLDIMNRISSLVLDEGEMPHKFRVLQMPISDYVKSSVIKKITTLSEVNPDSGEGTKLKNWLDAFMRIPFGKTVPLPVKLEDGREKCTEFMTSAKKTMDQSIYGMNSAKTQIMQIIAQWIVNPNSVGNVIALSGPPGVGKTSLARNAIAEVLKRPFEFFTLGGASDIANYIGHSYTYEGSLWGRIADSLMHAKAMNPVMYFDELDKISTTPHGEEIVSMLIHLTDRSQNSQFHDRYFAGVDFDLSQCLFVFSFNDMDKVHPILRDRMTVINCGGYSDSDKKVILKDYIWPQIAERLRFKEHEVTLSSSAISHIVEEYSSDEKGVRNLIRATESMMTRLNMLRIADAEMMKDYKFYMDVKFPLTIDKTVVETLLGDFSKKEPETWRSLYN